MKYLNKYTYVLIGLIVISGITIAFIIPNFQREEFSQDVIDDIIEGVLQLLQLQLEMIIVRLLKITNNLKL